MPAAARLGDKAQVGADAHGCPACPHPAIGPIVSASPDVSINGRGAARQDDLGIHAACCGPNNFSISKGSATVYVNGKPLARMGDSTKHCGGTGPIVDGSPDVLIDDGAEAAQGVSSSSGSQQQIATAQAAESKKKEAKKASDSHAGGGGGGGAKDVAKDAKDEKKSGSIVSARWSVQRAANGQEVELQVECKDPKGQLQIEIWAQSADRAQDKKVKSDSASAAKSVKKKVKLEIPQDAAGGNECHFYFVVKDDQGGEKKSDPLFVDRAPFRFSV
ncbi:MAG TPA: PAAR domain-containing protein [Myxococcales bacterium]|jgi:uncharacterized Zn-binding protein involved in type VI secretion|nr:PAAR domain-containing protein [Myxococcales bacterium]